MAPLGPLRTDDGPACRVCGCTRRNACVVEVVVNHHPQCREAVGTGACTCEAGPIGGRGRIGCSWYETGIDEGKHWLCTACAGTEADMAEVIDRGLKLLLKSSSVASAGAAVAMGQAALERRRKRQEGG